MYFKTCWLAVNVSFFSFFLLEGDKERDDGDSNDDDNDFETWFASKLTTVVISIWTEINKQNKVFYQAKQSVLPDSLFKRSWLKLSLDDYIKSLETNYWVIARFL